MPVLYDDYEQKKKDRIGGGGSGGDGATLMNATFNNTDVSSTEFGDGDGDEEDEDGDDVDGNDDDDDVESGSSSTPSPVPQEAVVALSIFEAQRMYRIVLVVNVICMCVHSFFFLGFGYILIFQSGTVFSRYFFNDFNTDFLSPLIPIWNPIGDVLPFGNYFLIAKILSFGFASVNFLLANLCILINCFYTKRHLSFHCLLVIFCFVYANVTLLYVVHPAFLAHLIFNRDAGDMVNLIGICYGIVETNAFTNALNMVMVLGHCCGIKGPKDFIAPYNLTVHPDMNPYAHHPTTRIKAIPKWPNKLWTSSIQIPPACCKRVGIFKDVDRDFEELLRCADGKDPKLYYNKGCLEVYTDLFDVKYRLTLQMIGLVTGIFMLVLAVWGTLRLCQGPRKAKINRGAQVPLVPEVRYYEESYDDYEEEITQEEEEEDRVKEAVEREMEQIESSTRETFF